MPARAAALIAIVVALVAGGQVAGHPAGAQAAAQPEGSQAVVPQAAAAAASIRDQLNAWTPTDGRWTVTNDRDTEGTRGDCSDGRLIQFANDQGDAVGFVWGQCGNHAKALDLLRKTWAPNGMFPAIGATPAFADGSELISPYPAFDGLNRLWTQGNWFLTVSRSCGTGECDALTADYARSIAALVGQPVDVIPPVAHRPNDYFGGWTPTDENGWLLGAADPLLGADIARCIEGASDTFSGTDGSYLQAFWVRCANPRAAFALQNEKWADLNNSDGLALAFGSGYDRVSRYGTSGVSRSWVQGDIYVNIERTCPVGGDERCGLTTLQYARQLSALLPGEVTQDTTAEAAVVEAGWLFIAVPVGTVLLLLVPQRLYFWARSRGYSVETDNPEFRSVDRLVRRVRIGRIVRRVIVTALSLAAWLFVIGSITTWLPNPAIDIVVVLFSPFVFFSVFGLLLRLVWKLHPLIALARRRGRPTALGVVGTGIRWFAALLAGLAIVTYFFASLMLITDREVTAATVREQIGAAFTEPIFLPNAIFSGLRWAVHALDDTGTYFFVFLIMLVVPVTLAYFLDRFGQRLTRRGLQATLATDDRPYFLYLRGFDEDRLRIDESVGRRGFLELFTPFGRPRFEEVLVEYLTRYGPVIAISGGKQVLSDLGAAKITLGNDEWRDKVIEWSAGARAVVMSATPREVRAGLEWEMEHVSAQAGDVNIMLVVSPWSRREIARRWTGFLARAGELPLFRPLLETPMPDGVEVMTYAPGRGWRGYGSRRRWDWSYAASIITSIDNGDFDTRAAIAHETDGAPSAKLGA